MGLPYPGVELRIAENGEILAKGPNVMKGYWNNREATNQAIDAEGWFHTGDVGEFDADGFLRITDRIKDLIVTAGGKKVAPQPIEGRTTLSPFIAHAIMVGDQRPFITMLVIPDFERLIALGVRARPRGGRPGRPLPPADRSSNCSSRRRWAGCRTWLSSSGPSASR